MQTNFYETKQNRKIAINKTNQPINVMETN
jgi:hypothetical protein